MDSKLYFETDNDEENANCKHESHSEEEDPSEEEFNEESDEEHHYEEESNEEEGPCEEIIEEEDPDGEADEEVELHEQQIAEELSWKEPAEGDPEEDLAEEHIGVHCEDLSEGFETQSSSNSGDEGCGLGSKPSSSEKKRRSADEPQGYVKKRQKQDEDSKLETYSYSTGTVFKDKPHSLICDENITEKVNAGSSGKKKRSRWDKEPETYRAEVGSDQATKRRKTRWANDDAQLKLLGPLKLPDFVKSVVGDTPVDPVIEKLNSQLFEINRELNDQPPISDELGIGISTTEAGLRTRLIKCRQEIISELIKRNPTFHPPPDQKPSKLYKKLYIPVKEYPGYNFIGLIIGPRGNTQKRMEMETGAKILLRGKGCTRERRVLKYKDARRDSSEDEDLHVYIEADNQNSLDAAVQMVEKLLVPVEEAMNKHKRAQLRELAALNGKLREGSSKVQKTTSRASTPCDICGNAMHPTAACPLIASNPGTGKSDNFLSELGSTGVSPFIYPPLPSSRSTLMANQEPHALATSNRNPLKESDETKIFVGYLPKSTNDDKLTELFSPFGCISEVAVIKDKTTGLSKGYGFVKYSNSVCAAEAVARMNGYRIGGKMLSVQVAGQPSSAVKTCILPGAPTNLINPPIYPSPAAVSQGKPGFMTWPGPPGSMLSETNDFFPKKSIFVPLADFICGPSPLSFGASGQNYISPLIPHAVTSSKELEQFPGYLKSVDFQDQSYTNFNKPPSKYVYPTCL